ncbi:MAG: hypothetical protein HYS27_02010 [Deltaproteobacteria bacterium]|nr:hypothetical protein [Deltaproteobacteria bacterium]
MWTRPRTEPVGFVAVALALAFATGCSTVIKPTRPDPPLVADGAPLAGVRFDGDSTALREPGLPVSPGRGWQREVQNYTATSLNTLLSTPDDAPAARTITSMDLAGPSAIQIGTWKEMTIALTSTLPDGTVVKSEPVTGNIDDGFEYAVVTGLGVGGTVLDVTSAVAFIFLFISQDPTVMYVAIGALVGGLALNIAQSSSQYFVAASEERRWSNLYAQALAAHAREVRQRIGTGPPPRPPLPSPPDVPADPSDAPPPLLEPAPTP